MSLLISFCFYLEEALPAGVRGFAVDNCLLIPGFPPRTPSQGNSKKKRVKYTVLAKSVFVLLGRTSKIKSPKNKYTPQCTLYYRCLGGSIQQCREGVSRSAEDIFEGSASGAFILLGRTSEIINSPKNKYAQKKRF